MKQFDNALAALRSGTAFCKETDVVEFHNILFYTSKCELEVGDYSRAIEFGEGALEMNIIYEGAYTHVALAYKALGNINEAARMLQRAIVYETPWDLDNLKKVRDLAKQLTREAEETFASNSNDSSSNDNNSNSSSNNDNISSSSNDNNSKGIKLIIK